MNEEYQLDILEYFQGWLTYLHITVRIDKVYHLAVSYDRNKRTDTYLILISVQERTNCTTTPLKGRIQPFNYHSSFNAIVATPWQENRTIITIMSAKRAQINKNLQTWTYCAVFFIHCSSHSRSSLQMDFMVLQESTYAIGSSTRFLAVCFKFWVPLIHWSPLSTLQPQYFVLFCTPHTTSYT